MRHFWLAFVLMLGVLPSLTASAQDRIRDQKLVLAIGIGDFEDTRWPTLKYVEKDAAAVYQSLKNNFDGGWLLTPQSTGQAVTRQRVLDAFAQLEKENRSENDTIVIYFSGHGTLASGPRPETGGLGLRKFLVMGDTRFAQPDTGLGIDELLERFQKLRSRRKALIIDSCYAGGGKAYLTPQIMSILAQQRAGAMQEPQDTVVESAAIYTASAWAEEARESEKLGHGVYTYFLLEGFKSDLDGDGAVSLSEAHQYASNRVIAYTQGSQHPTAKVEFVGKDPVLVSGKSTKVGASILYAWQWTLRKYEVFVNRSPLGTLEEGALPIPDGKHQLVIMDPQTKKVVLDRVVEFEKGRDYSLSELFVSQPTHHITLGPTALQFMASDLKDRWSPKPWGGWQLSYQKDEAWRDFNFHAQFSQYAARRQNVVIDLEDDGAGQSYDMTDQDITAQKIMLALGKHEDIPWLSRRASGIQTRWQWHVGPEMLMVQRSLSVYGDRDFTEKQTVGGLALGLSLHSVFLYPHIDLSLGVSVDALRDVFLDQTVAVTSTFHLGVGSSW
ncbi:caspase family protein [Oligoflexus tunisiensis]|uniref:caspase family protein n=1 Tax=Oligoflexus tunisiensis TaxID=708132 RepID=UPI00114D249E|nr:caspase family protein [Oligoflexus tunisiensis]